MINEQIINGEIVEIDYTDFHDLKANKKYQKYEIGLISITTGEIAITDPQSLSHPYPLSKKVQLGKYPVSLYYTQTNVFWGYKTAYATIDFLDEIAHTFEFALIDYELLEHPVDKTINGMFPVDSGLLSFSDYQSLEEYISFTNDFLEENEDGNIYEVFLEKHFKMNGNKPKGSSITGDWVNFSVPNSDNKEIFMFSTGLGDGLYPAYWGLNKANEITSLIIDFLTLERLNK
jgi:Protein of unknown function (DUF4241)